jgi:hypothetical protein
LAFSRDVEGKHTIDDRPDAMLLHYATHVLEIAAAADCDRLERSLTHKHGHEVQSAHGTPENADHGYLAAKGDCLDRLHQRIGTADFHHTIHAATPGERTHLIAPLGHGAIVDDMVCAKLSETPGFLGARGAVTAAHGSVAASSNVRCSGIETSASALTTLYSVSLYSCQFS